MPVTLKIDHPVSLSVFSVPDELKNGITEKETEEIFFEVLQDKVTDKLAPLGYKVKTLTDVNDDIQLLYGVNFTETNLKNKYC